MVLVTGSPPFVHFLSRMWMGQEDNVPVISVEGGKLSVSFCLIPVANAHVHFASPRSDSLCSRMSPDKSVISTRPLRPFP